MMIDETKKRAHDPQIVRAEENLMLSYGGPIQGFGVYLGFSQSVL